jgi:hypothetical protein
MRIYRTIISDGFIAPTSEDNYIVGAYFGTDTFLYCKFARKLSFWCISLATFGLL